MDLVPQGHRKVGVGGREEEERDGFKEAETGVKEEGYCPCFVLASLCVCEGKQLFLKPNLPHLPNTRTSEKVNSKMQFLVY